MFQLSPFHPPPPCLKRSSTPLISLGCVFATSCTWAWWDEPLSQLLPCDRSAVVRYRCGDIAVASQIVITGGDGEPQTLNDLTWCTAEPANKPGPRCRYIPWAELLRRTFAIDVVCQRCGGALRLIALVKTEATIRTILTAMGLLAEALRRSTRLDPLLRLNHRVAEQKTGATDLGGLTGRDALVCTGSTPGGLASNPSCTARPERPPSRAFSSSAPCLGHLPRPHVPSRRRTPFESPMPVSRGAGQRRRSARLVRVLVPARARVSRRRSSPWPSGSRRLSARHGPLARATSASQAQACCSCGACGQRSLRSATKRPIAAICCGPFEPDQATRTLLGAGRPCAARDQLRPASPEA
jgi:hypothetical protein